MSEHSPTPWIVQEDIQTDWNIRDAVDDFTAAYVSKPDADRIVAAVNATASIPLAALEAGIVTELVATIGFLVQHFGGPDVPTWCPVDACPALAAARAILTRLAPQPQEAAQ